MKKSESMRRHIRTNLASLKIVGLWSDDDHELFETKFYWKYAMFVHVIIGGSFNLGLFMYLYTNFSSLDLVAENTFLVLLFSLNIPFAKTVFFLKGWTLLKDLVKQLDQEEFQPRNAEEEAMVFSSFRAYRATNLILAVTVAFLLPLWLISPLIIPSEEPKLPLLSWYPFDFRIPRYYTVAYLHQVLGVAYTVFNNWNLDLITFGLMAFLAAECDILSYRLRNVRIGYTMEEDLVHHMKHHWKILKFAEDANNFIGTLILVQFTVSCLSSCMTLFELSVLPTSSVLFYGALQTQFSLSAELLINCYFGNNVLSKSEGISDALYAMPWFDGSECFKKNTLFFLMRAQKPIRVLAVNLFLLSLPTFTSIMRMSFSFFTVLHQSQLKRDKQ